MPYTLLAILRWPKCLYHQNNSNLSVRSNASKPAQEGFWGQVVTSLLQPTGLLLYHFVGVQEHVIQIVCSIAQLKHSSELGNITIMMVCHEMYLDLADFPLLREARSYSQQCGNNCLALHVYS